VAPTALLFLAALALHLAAMWPSYPAEAAKEPIVSSPMEIAIYVGLEIGWAAAAVLVLGRRWAAGGICLAAGLGAVEVGYLIADLATSVQVYNGDTPGVWLALAGWGLGVAGALWGGATVTLGRPAMPSPAGRLARAVLRGALGLLAAGSFLPSWDRFSAVASATGRSASFTAGNVFSQPAGPMAGDLVAVTAIAAVALASAYWGQLWAGAWATAGVVLALGAQLVSALVQAAQGVPPSLLPGLMRAFGLTPATARALGVHFSIRLTGWWTADVAATVALAAAVAWDAVASRAPAPAVAAGEAQPGAPPEHQQRQLPTGQAQGQGAPRPGYGWPAAGQLPPGPAQGGPPWPTGPGSTGGQWPPAHSWPTAAR